MKTLGEKLIELRKEKEWTQENFANSLHVTRQAVSSWERDKTEPDIGTLKQICELYQIDMNNLILDVNLEKKVVDTKIASLCYVILVVVNAIQIILAIPQADSMDKIIFPVMFILMASSIYFAFTYSIKNRDFSLLSGYDHHVPYNKEVLAQMVATMETMVLLETVGFSILMGLVSFLGQLDKIGGILFFSYILSFVASLLLSQNRYQDKIYLDQEYPKKAKSGNKIIIYFLIFVVILVGEIIFFDLTNRIPQNSPQSALMVIFLVPVLFCNVIWLLIQQDRLARCVEKGEVYQFNHSFIGICLLDAGLLLTLAWLFL